MIAENKFSKIVALWKEDKKQYVKRSTFAAYTLLIENHILPSFGEMALVEEQDVQTFVFRKLNEGLSHKTIKDILIVLKMILRFGAKNQMTAYRQIDIKFPFTIFLMGRIIFNRFFVIGISRMEFFVFGVSRITSVYFRCSSIT